MIDEAINWKMHVMAKNLILNAAKMLVRFSQHCLAGSRNDPSMFLRKN